MTGLIEVKSKVMTEETVNQADLVAKWIAFAQVKPASVRAYTKGVKNFFAFVKTNDISNITREVLIGYKEYLGVKYRAATANLYMTATKLFIGFLYQQSIIPVNVADRIKNFKVSEQHTKDALSAQATKKIIAAFDTATLKGKRDKAIYTLMTTCGLRCVEVMRANVGDLVTRGEKIFLQVQGKGRDDKAECVEVPAPVMNLINMYLADRAGVVDDAPLFASVSHRNFGGRLTTTSISRIIKETLRNNGINSSRITAHSLRHTCANTMILNGVDLRRVQEVLRHKNITVTQRYLHELDRYNNGGENICAAAFGL
ncbi:MAG: tyrosine-type recombinase/integrase [Selenomonadaceae bacterium]|nr:tyrosine-type recombinase/integrase [Selenomonadaceae bacterium]